MPIQAPQSSSVEGRWEKMRSVSVLTSPVMARLRPSASEYVPARAALAWARVRVRVRVRVQGCGSGLWLGFGLGLGLGSGLEGQG